MKRSSMSLRLASLILSVLLFSAAIPVCAEEFHYTHDPRLNAKAMEEAVVDPTAIYGFSPSLTGTLSTYAKFDWTNPEEVATIREERLTYLDGYAQLDQLLSELAQQGKSTEEIARAVSAKRNEIRLAAYADDPEMLSAVKERNLEKYGHEEGPLPEELFEKYGSWEKVMDRAFAVNPGVDACVGLYDDYYDYYVAFAYIEDEHTAAAPREYAIAKFAEASGLEGDSDLSAFTDGDQVSVWYQDSIEAAVANGVTKGYDDGTLRPQGTIRRIEALVILSRCLPDLDAVQETIAFTDVPEWAAEDIDRLTKAGLVKGYGNGLLGSNDNLTVEQVGILVQRVAE